MLSAVFRPDRPRSVSRLEDLRLTMISQTPDLRTLYVDLLKESLTQAHASGRFAMVQPPGRRYLQPGYYLLRQALGRFNLHLVKRSPVADRAEGRDWPISALTMAGEKRIDQLRRAIESVLVDNVPGDLIETGVWRGGLTIFMRGVLKAYGDTARRVWVADSFEGLPKPNTAKYPADVGDVMWKQSRELAVSVDEVKANFARYGLLDDQVGFLKGWFKDTLPQAPIDRLAVMRLDGDLYESTMDALTALYPKLSVGGYCIVDDYGACPPCAAAVTDYRAKHDITEPIQTIDWTGVYWRRER